jgi:hypothetical protein
MRFDLSDKDCALRNAAGEHRHRSLHSHYGCLKRRPRGLHHHAAWLYALLFLGGSSSPFIGDLPTTARLRTFSAFGISARAARAVK